MSVRLNVEATYISRWDDAQVEIETPCHVSLLTGQITSVAITRPSVDVSVFDGVWVRLGIRELRLHGMLAQERVGDLQALRDAYAEHMGFGLDFESFEALQDTPNVNTRITFRSRSDALRDCGSVVLRGAISGAQLSIIGEQLLEGYGLAPVPGNIEATVRTSQPLALVGLTLQGATLDQSIGKVVTELAQVADIEVTPVRYA